MLRGSRSVSCRELNGKRANKITGPGGEGGGGLEKSDAIKSASPYPSHRYRLHTTRHTLVTLGWRECGDSSSECHRKRGGGGAAEATRRAFSGGARPLV